MKKFLVYLILVILLNQYNLLAQMFQTLPHEASASIMQNIESQMLSKYGKKFYLSRYFIMDSLTADPQLMASIQDPFETLSGTAVFACQKAGDGLPDSLKFIPDSSIVGVYKDGTIIWDSGPIIYGNIITYMPFCKDITADGTVDIGLIAQYFDYEYNNPNETINYLWLLSWDGNNGRFINDYDLNTGKSKLIPYIFYLFDWNGDGIYEISSEWINPNGETYPVPSENPPTNFPLVTYGWDGNKYGYWNSVYQLKWDDFFPARWVQAKIRCKVKKFNGLLLFEYSVKNNSTSKQSVEDIYITGIDTTLIDNSSKYDGSFTSTVAGLVDSAWLFTANTFNYLIKPGEIKNGYWYKGIGLPSLHNVYIRGSVPPHWGGVGNNVITDDMISNDIYKNSFKTITVSLNPIPQELDSLGFVDTIKVYTDKSLQLGWIKNQQTADKYNGYLTTARTALQQNNISLASINLQNIIRDVDIDSSGAITSEAYALLRYNTEYLLSKLPQPPNGLPVKLANSNGAKLPGGSLQYYEGEWKNAVDNGDGTFTVDTQLKTVSLRMTYEYGSQTKSNVSVGTDTVVFQTVNTLVKLKDSSGNPLDTGKVQYYAGGWRNFGSTINGTASKELLAANYTFRVSYGYASNDKAQNLDTNSTVIFKTVNTSVQLKDSQGNLITVPSTVQYYSGGWREFGTTTNGIVNKELLPNNYTFRMGYGFATNDKAQNIGTNPNVVFQTVNANVELRNSTGNLIDQGTVQYYSGGWREFGTTTNGIASKELLPNNYTFRMSYGFASNDKAQNIGTNPTVVFQTVNANVELRNSLNDLIDQGTVQYYSGGWRQFGTTENGAVSKELLPNNYTFRMSYGFASNDKAQNIGTNPTVVFQTVNANVELRNSLNNLIDQGTVQYYSGGWREFGTTENGAVSKELLPNNYTFRMTYGFASNDKAQNIGTNPTVVFQTVNANVELRNSSGNLMPAPMGDQVTVQYYSGGWREFGSTTNGVANKELLPNNYTFRMAHEFISNDKAQNIGTNSTVTFSTILCTVRVKNIQNQPIENAAASYYSGGWRQLGTTVNGMVSKELLPANLTFRVSYQGTQQDKTQNLSANSIVDFTIGQ